MEKLASVCDSEVCVLNSEMCLVVFIVKYTW